MISESVLRINSLFKYYGGLCVLDNINFSMQSGEVIGLVGRRGAGKSSLLHIIAGVSAASSGEIFFRNKKVSFSSPRQAHAVGIELVQQSPYIVEQLDVVHNIFLGREICSPPKIGLPDFDQMYQRAKSLLISFDLPVSLLYGRSINLSDEQRQVVSIARALCGSPRLLLLDDCMESLSYQRQQLLLEHIKQVSAQGTSVIISSDNLKHQFSITNRILVLYEGHLIADRITAECTQRDIVELIVGTSSREQITPIIWALESFHAAQRQTEELYHAQAALHNSLEARDSLNRQLVRQLSDQVKALDTLNAALQEAQRRLMTEREEERKSVARDLHDQIIQDLLSINYSLEEAQGGLEDEPVCEELTAIRVSIRHLVSDLRQICQDLRPPTIDNHGLPSAIRSLTQEWSERNNITLHLQIDPDLGRLPETIELSVFRIVQEGLNNVRKHAQAKNVELSISRTAKDNLLIRLVDDGTGITASSDLASLSANNHFGLLGISERAALFGGSMHVQSPDDGGLVLEVEIPSPYPSV